MARTCPFCGQRIVENDETVPYKSRIAHRKCFDIAAKAIAERQKEAIKEKVEEKKDKKKNTKKKPVELKNGLSEKEYKERTDLLKYVKECILRIDELPAQTFILVDKYKEQYTFTYENMKKTLIYFYEIQEHAISTKDSSGVTIIPYVYAEAMKHYEEIESILAKVSKHSVNDMYKIKHVTYAPKTKKKKLIDMNSFGGGMTNE